MPAKPQWDAFAVKIRPLVKGAVQPHRQVFEAFVVHHLHPVLHLGQRVFESDRRQTARQVAGTHPFVAALCDLPQEAVDGGAGALSGAFSGE